MGVIFQQAPHSGERKHNCQDCGFCQMCSDSRCHACRAQGTRPESISVAEQLERFERLNKGEIIRPDLPMTMAGYGADK